MTFPSANTSTDHDCSSTQERQSLQRVSELRTILKRASKIATQQSPYHGYGVFATEDISYGEIIEEGTFKVSGLRTNDLVHREVRQFLLTYPCVCEECKIRGEHFIFTTGCTIQYNSIAVKKDSFIRYHFDLEN